MVEASLRETGAGTPILRESTKTGVSSLGTRRLRRRVTSACLCAWWRLTARSLSRSSAPTWTQTTIPARRASWRITTIAARNWFVLGCRADACRPRRGVGFVGYVQAGRTRRTVCRLAAEGHRRRHARRGDRARNQTEMGHRVGDGGGLAGSPVCAVIAPTRRRWRG